MKIGLITPGFSSSESDWCIPALLNLVRELAKAHDVHVFTLRYPHRVDTYPVYGATVHALGGAAVGGLRRLPLLTRAVQAVIGESRRGSFDVLHALWADEPGFVAVTAGRILKTRTVVSILGGELVSLPDIGYGHQLSRAARWLVNYSLTQATSVTVGSASLRDRVVAAGVLRGASLHIMPLGVDTDLFTPGPAKPLAGSFRLLHVASLEPIKNQTMLLQAFAQVRAHGMDAHLHLAGTGRLQSDLEHLAETLNIAAGVTFHGEVAHEHLPDYYRAADLCVLTSHFESQSMVALEAAACGKLTAGTRVGLLPELVPDSFLVMPGDTAGLARLLGHIARNPRLLTSPEHQIHLPAPYALMTSVKSWQDLYGG